VINPAVDLLAEHTSVAKACALLDKPRASHYRAKHPPVLPVQRQPRASPANALSSAEQDAVITTRPARGSATSPSPRPGQPCWTKGSTSHR